MQILCDQERPDVQAALGLPISNVGFEFTIPEKFIDGKPHELSVRLPDRSVLPLTHPTDPEADPVPVIKFTQKFQPQYQSFVDGVKQGALRGWLLKAERPGAEMHGGCMISVMVDGVRIAQARADRYRGDVAAVLGCDPNCGFEIPIPQRLRGSTPRQFKIVTLPDNTELNGSPFVTSLADDALETRLVDLLGVIDGLHRQLSALRQEVRDLVPRRGYNLGDYNRWAQKYYPLLRERTARQRQLEEGKGYEEPLVSILCPTYRPLKSDFEAAINSVLSQTYQNWELIIVDDAGKCAQTTAIINAFCKADKRIRAVPLKKNAGISGATNAGMDAARGQYVVFFDHDDLMVDVAVEVMVRAARETGARLLYSDEDKIDQAGYFLEPNLKPDFNYRYLLGCNYVCHLTMVEADTMRAIGHLKSDYDGAQDHDFILRATEILKPSEIHHVPEILYHWRKTPNSTAVNVANKTYAIEAGVRCVHDHLKRRGVKAKVSSIRGLTLYGVQWLTRKTPKVTIIIPFKDQVETTRQCVEALLTKTAYKAFDIILVNNWSVEDETAAFIEEMQAHPKVSVLTVEEPFNYSRLNNLAVEQTKADYLMFMNNDVFVEHEDWLHIAIGEALSAPDVGAVGAKLLYPNDTIQHAGVIVGPAGIGAHVHRGDPVSEYGFIGRTMLSHEVTAVTAAAMLVRADVFREIGGFDEKELTVAYNDVDLCLKIRDAGYRIIFCAEIVAYHHESLSRGSDDRPEHEARFFHETQTMLARWSNNPLFERDPAYPRYFTVDHQPFFDLVDPETL
ncbi:O-antigen biosynthesis protein RfbC [Gluconobacter japonicus NBRC 3271]|nr:O-antigen biosynthesis protein RfbC [Gluconobacter japonicus NBRC 3271]